MDYLWESLSDLLKLQESCMVGNIENGLCCESELMSRWIKDDGRNRKRKVAGENKNKNKIKRFNEKETIKFISVPFNENLFNLSKGLVKKYNLNVKLAPRPIQRNGQIVFANVKDRSTNSNVKNCLFAVKCEHCEFKVWFKTMNLDVERTLEGKFLCNESRIKEHMKMNEGHVIPFSVYEKKIYKNLFELNLAYRCMSRENEI